MRKVFSLILLLGLAVSTANAQDAPLTPKTLETA
jgi:hypothetical protein